MREHWEPWVVESKKLSMNNNESFYAILLALCPAVHNFLSFMISFINHPFEALYEFIRGSTDRKLALF
jgi:hypothetical protein